MKERPILFQGAMVRALLAGTKTQTRRVLKPQPVYAGGAWKCADGSMHQASRPSKSLLAICPYSQPGDRLWVREAWRTLPMFDGLPPRDLAPQCPIRYEAEEAWRNDLVGMPGKYRPPMFMPRWACRLVLEVTDVRVERLNDINEADALAEGALFHDGRGVGHSGYRHDGADGYVWDTARSSYRHLWNRINGLGSWDLNPWVWVVSLARETAEEKRS